MKTVKILFETALKSYKLFHNVPLKLLLSLTILLTQSTAFALQFESISVRDMNAYKKFDGVTQNALVIKAKIDQSKYFDRLEFSSGELGNEEDSSFFVSAGPSWRFNKRMSGRGVGFIELGTSPTWIENGNFGDESLGGHLFFTSNVQLGMHFGYRRENTLSVRVHHISNGGLSSKNPGTDMIGIELSYALGR